MAQLRSRSTHGRAVYDFRASHRKALTAHRRGEEEIAVGAIKPMLHAARMTISTAPVVNWLGSFRVESGYDWRPQRIPKPVYFAAVAPLSYLRLMRATSLSNRIARRAGYSLNFNPYNEETEGILHPHIPLAPLRRRT